MEGLKTIEKEEEENEELIKKWWRKEEERGGGGGEEERTSDLSGPIAEGRRGSEAHTNLLLRESKEGGIVLRLDVIGAKLGKEKGDIKGMEEEEEEKEKER